MSSDRLERKRRSEFDTSDSSADEHPAEKIRRVDSALNIGKKVSKACKNLLSWITPGFLKNMAVRVSSSLGMGTENNFRNPYPIEVDDDVEEIAVIGVQNGTGIHSSPANSLRMNVTPRGSRSSNSSICPLATTPDPLSSDSFYYNQVSRAKERRKMNGFPGRTDTRRGDMSLPRRCVAPITNPRTEMDILLDDKDDVEIINEVYKHSSPPTRKIRLLSNSNVSKSDRTKCIDDSSFAPYFTRSYTADEVYRLQEKAQYKLLLEKVVKRPPIFKPAILKEDSRTSTIQVDLTEDDDISNHWYFKKEKVEENVKDFLSKYYKPASLIPFSEMKPQLNTQQPVSEREKDDDIQIIEYPDLPKWKPRKPAVKCDVLFTNGWIEDMKTSIVEKTEKTLQAVCENELKIQRYRTRREAKIAEEKRKREEQRLAGFIIPEDVDMEKEVLPEITPEMDAIIDKALLTPSNDKLSSFSARENYEVTRSDLITLTQLNWLNDQVINFYMGLIEVRSAQNGYLSVFCFTSFFYTKLKKEGVSNRLLRWTKREDIFARDLIFVPLHLDFHWALVVIDQRVKQLRYYDSMGNGVGTDLKIIENYLVEEMKDKKKAVLEPNTYSYEVVKGIPKQMNGSDCGMFTLKYAEYLSRDAPLTFTQEQMPYFRRRMVYELLAKQIL